MLQHLTTVLCTTARLHAVDAHANQFNRRFPYGLVRVARAASLNTEDSWMYEDGQDEVVFCVDRPCQLLGVGLCGTEGSFTVELDVYEVGVIL